MFEGGDTAHAAQAWVAVVRKGDALDLAESLHSFGDLPTAFVPESLGGCVRHILFS